MTTPVCAVGAIVMDHGDILLVKRDREPSKGLWTLPGGRLEPGETLREAVIREVKEETGVDIDVDGLIGVAEWISREDDGTLAHHYVILDFTARPRGRELRRGDDAADVRWVPASELADLPLTSGLLEFLADRGVLEGRRPRAQA